ncbi:MAG: fucose-binding lectin II [Acidobacteriota bacterium]|nr:fucose-binding lectin II [Acidobacteriota bacterium]
MSFGPTKQPIEINMWPGKRAQWSMSTQAAFTQNLTVKDATGKVLVNHSASGTGNYFAGTGTFVGGKNPHTVTLTANGRPSKVQYDGSAMVLGGKAQAKTYNFAAEDASDGDYNDCFVSITWFAKQG